MRWLLLVWIMRAAIRNESQPAAEQAGGVEIDRVAVKGPEEADRQNYRPIPLGSVSAMS
ncbi:MAG TPA: hypothetical protein VIV11_12680 [Kofleriaceae bacterium]